MLNRAVARLTLFEKQEDDEAFERVLEEAVVREALPIFSYTIMPNHWHFVVRPETDWQRSAFFRRLTHTHTMRWHAHYHTTGTGHLYQGRFKSKRGTQPILFGTVVAGLSVGVDFGERSAGTSVDFVDGQALLAAGTRGRVSRVEESRSSNRGGRHVKRRPVNQAVCFFSFAM